MNVAKIAELAWHVVRALLLRALEIAEVRKGYDIQWDDVLKRQLADIDATRST
jgi:hypothetical protein